MKKQDGITLIALVITIIVLLILAGITISLVIGDNGILTQATYAVEESKDAEVKEDVAMAWASVDSDYFSNWSKNPKTIKRQYFTENNLNLYLKKRGQVKDLNYNEKGTSTLTYTSKKNPEIEYTVTIQNTICIGPYLNLQVN